MIKRPYIFEKHGIQGYRILHSRVSNVKYTNTQIHKYKMLKILINGALRAFNWGYCQRTAGLLGAFQSLETILDL